MQHNNSEIKAAARVVLENNWMTAALLMLMYFILTGTFSYTIEEYWGVLLLLIILPLQYGLYSVFLYLSREDKLDMGLFLDGFKDFKRVFLTELMKNIYICLWSLLLIVPGIIKSYSYAMTEFLMLDNPNLSYDEAITESMRMMQGYKMKLFMLDLSFIGWFLLCLLTLGIGFLWLHPYVYTSHAYFYETLKNGQEPTMP